MTCGSGIFLGFLRFDNPLNCKGKTIALKPVAKLIHKNARGQNKFVKTISICVAILPLHVIIARHFGQFSEPHFEMFEPRVIVFSINILIRVMAQNSTIEWTNATWNPVTGCTKISAGCDNCYAERFSERFRGVKEHPFEYGFDLTLRPERIKQPLSWKKAKMIFVNSMSDLFHKDVSKDYIASVFEIMEKADWHIFQVLTKRSSLMKKFVNERYKDEPVPEHIWLGVSVENYTKRSRIRHLQNTNASVRFLSIEPLIGPPGNMDLKNIQWVIVGGESGPNARPMRLSWARSARDQCLAQKIPFFFKQWGGYRPKSGGRKLDGKEWNEFPELSDKVTCPQQLFLAAE